MSSLDAARQRIRQNILADEGRLIRDLVERTGLDANERVTISNRARDLVEAVRSGSKLGLMESFLAEYGLATDEGLALMTLAEALLRVPDADTVDALIEDKVGASEWSAHFGASQSPLVNFSTRALSLAADVLGEPDGRWSALHGAIKRLGEPVIRAAVSQAMRVLGSQFVFGRNIDEAIARLTEAGDGDTYSYDMLGEAARSAGDAQRYMAAYADAIARLAPHCTAPEVRDNPGISVKLSALHPRYEFAKRDRVLSELVEATRALALAARAAGMGFNIDAEEADRLDLSLDVIAAVLATPGLAEWEGFGIVVQAYGKRALPVIDWLDELAGSLDRRIMVRLVKGAYWDAEIKRAQTLGLDGFPVFTRKAATDVSYIAAARLLLSKPGIYPQFATHNAHTAAAVLHLANKAGRGTGTFEFQRLHGMGKALHDGLKATAGTRTRVYAPVGIHKDLLAYLVRRLLENGANGSFVYQIADAGIPAEVVAEDPIAKVIALGEKAGANPAIALPRDLFAPKRLNSAGLDLTDPVAVDAILAAREAFRTHRWAAAPLIEGPARPLPARPVINPTEDADTVGSVAEASAADIETAFVAAAGAFPAWSSRPATERAAILCAVADLYEANRPELFAILAREAGKTLADAVSEVREAVDFLRYYAAEAISHPEGERRGIVACISPWNFPLAIFTGQIAAALAAGNVVLAKPAGQTPILAWRAVQLMHAAGVPVSVIQLLPGEGSTVGAALSRDARVAAIAFTGSLPTAHRIDQAMAETMSPDAPLIAETGGINAMIVDSTALPEQVVRDILASAFQSAGQRCSALRIVYIQEEAAERTIEMLLGAMDELAIGDPWELETDVGPVIDAAARDKIEAHVAEFASRSALIKQLRKPADGTFVAPAVLQVAGIEDIATEVFGPVLHVATYRSADLERVVDAINASGYGLTFGLHTRISSRANTLAASVHAGNIYINRNQIGAVVGSQPFGGEGLSGTGPKAGGPNYLPRLKKLTGRSMLPPMENSLPGPTGETNVMRLAPRGTLLCLGPSEADRRQQIEMATATGNRVRIVDGSVALDSSLAERDFDAVACFGPEATLATVRRILARRDGAIMPLITDPAEIARLLVERHVCIDTTAAGGNASLMTDADGQP